MAEDLKSDPRYKTLSTKRAKAKRKITMYLNKLNEADSEQESYSALVARFLKNIENNLQEVIQCNNNIAELAKNFENIDSFIETEDSAAIAYVIHIEEKIVNYQT